MSPALNSALVICSDKRQNIKFTAISDNITYKEDNTCRSIFSLHSSNKKLNPMIDAQHNKCTNIITLNRLLDIIANL